MSIIITVDGSNDLLSLLNGLSNLQAASFFPSGETAHVLTFSPGSLPTSERLLISKMRSSLPFVLANNLWSLRGAGGEASSGKLPGACHLCFSESLGTD